MERYRSQDVPIHGARKVIPYQLTQISDFFQFMPYFLVKKKRKKKIHIKSSIKFRRLCKILRQYFKYSFSYNFFVRAKFLFNLQETISTFDNMYSFQ